MNSSLWGKEKNDTRDFKEYVENPRPRVQQTPASKPNDTTSSRRLPTQHCLPSLSTIFHISL